MGICIEQYRAKIGSFLQPKKDRQSIHGLCVTKKYVSLTLRLILAISMLITLSGDVESNPGPPKSTRQSTLSQEDTGAVGLNSKYSTDDLMNAIMGLKSEVKTANDRLTQLDSKVDNMASQVREQREEINKLSEENKVMTEQLRVMRDRLDDYESRSRRNNLLFHGINGEHNETWETSEKKVREFIRDTLEIPQADDILIVRAHRLRNGKRNPPIIANFVLTNDRNDVLFTAKRKIRDTGDTTRRVTEDLTQRVREARRSFAPLYSDALKAGLKPKIRHDRLIIDGKVYIHDRENNVNKCISERKQSKSQTTDEQHDHAPLFTHGNGSEGESTLNRTTRSMSTAK